MANPDGTLLFNESLNRTKYNNTVGKANAAVESATLANANTLVFAASAAQEDVAHSNDLDAHGLRTPRNQLQMNRFFSSRTYADDRFNRANGAVGTPEVGSAWSANSGTPQVTSNRFSSSVPGTPATEESVYLQFGTTGTTVLSDLIVAAVVNVAGKTGRTKIIVRSGGTNDLTVIVDPTQIFLAVYQASVSIRSSTYVRTPVGDEAIRIIAFGSRIEIWLNGELIIWDDNVPSATWNGAIFVLGVAGTSYVEEISVMNARRSI